MLGIGRARVDEGQVREALQLARLGYVQHLDIEQLDERAVLGARDGVHVADGGGHAEAFANALVREGASHRIRVRVTANEHHERLSADGTELVLELFRLRRVPHCKRILAHGGRRAGSGRARGRLPFVRYIQNPDRAGGSRSGRPIPPGYTAAPA